MTYRRILLATDPDGLAERAVPIAGALAREVGGEVFLVGVCAAGDPPERCQAVRERVRAASEELATAGVKVDSEIRQAAGDKSVGDEIVAASLERGADLVALGSHGRGDMLALIRGSVAQEVAAAIEVPVVLVHSRTPPPTLSLPAPLRRILVAVDFSEAAKQSARLAQDIALAERAQVLVLHVCEMVPWGDVPYVEPEDEAEQLVDGIAQTLRDAGCRVETRVTRPELSLATAISREADDWDADLIVLGSRRRTALGGLLLGSTAHAVVHRTSRAVVLAGHPVHEAKAVQQPGQS